MKLTELLPSVNFAFLIPKGRFTDSAFVFEDGDFRPRTSDKGIPCPTVEEIMPGIQKLKGWNLPELFYGTGNEFQTRQNWKYAWQYGSNKACDSMLLLYLERYFCEDGENRFQEGIAVVENALGNLPLNKYKRSLLGELLITLKNEFERTPQH